MAGNRSKQSVKASVSAEQRRQEEGLARVMNQLEPVTDVLKSLRSDGFQVEFSLNCVGKTIVDGKEADLFSGRLACPMEDAAAGESLDTIYNVRVVGTEQPIFYAWTGDKDLEVHNDRVDMHEVDWAIFLDHGAESLADAIRSAGLKRAMDEVEVPKSVL